MPSSQLLIDFDAACSLRDKGVDMAGWGSLTWVGCMREFAREHCQQHGSVTIDDVRAFAASKGLQPNSTHAFGAVFHELGWHVIGSEPSQVVSNRARRILRWRWMR